MQDEHKVIRLIVPYDVSIPSSSESEIPGGYEVRTRVDVTHRETSTTRPVQATVRLFLQQGSFQIETETVNIDGQRVKMVDSPEEKTLTMTVDDHPPVVVRAAANGRFEHRGRFYADNQQDNISLSKAIADQLEESHAQDDSVVANIEAANMGRELAARRGPKLFLIPVFVDITTEIKAQMNIQTRRSAPTARGQNRLRAGFS